MEFKSSIIFRPLQFSGVGQECPTDKPKGNKQTRHSELDSESIKASCSESYRIDPVENQTFFIKSKILEKAVNQVQGDKTKITTNLNGQ